MKKTSRRVSKKAKLVDAVLTKIPDGLKDELSNLSIKMENGLWSPADLKALGARILATASDISKSFASTKKVKRKVLKKKPQKPKDRKTKAKPRKKK